MRAPAVRTLFLGSVLLACGSNDPICDDRCADGGGVCNDGICLIDCALGSCDNEFTCPPGQHCDVLCADGGACSGTVRCGDAASCVVRCEGASSCPNEILCGSGPCTILCEGENSCANGVTCTNACACSVSCTGPGSCADAAMCPAGCEAGPGCTDVPGACHVCS